MGRIFSSRGASALEYVLLTSLLSLAMITSLRSLALKSNNTFLVAAVVTGGGSESVIRGGWECDMITDKWGSRICPIGLAPDEPDDGVRRGPTGPLSAGAGGSSPISQPAPGPKGLLGPRP